jgi:hypothetical protein
MHTCACVRSAAHTAQSSARCSHMHAHTHKQPRAPTRTVWNQPSLSVRWYVCEPKKSRCACMCVAGWMSRRGRARSQSWCQRRHQRCIYAQQEQRKQQLAAQTHQHTRNTNSATLAPRVGRPPLARVRAQAPPPTHTHTHTPRACRATNPKHTHTHTHTHTPRHAPARGWRAAARAGTCQSSRGSRSCRARARRARPRAPRRAARPRRARRGPLQRRGP